MKLIDSILIASVSAACTGDETVHETAVVDCDASGITVTVPKCAFDNMENLDVAAAFLNGPKEAGNTSNDGGEACKGNLSGDDYVFAANVGDCGTQISNNGTHMVYMNAIQAQQGTSNGVITRMRTLMIDFSCEFSLDHTVSLADGVSPSLTNIEVDMGTETGTFEVSMDLYTDSTFTDMVTGALTLNVPDPIHVQVRNNELTVQMKTCWATPSSDPLDSTSYTFIDDFCGDDLELNVFETLDVHRNGQSGLGRFSLASFMFNGESDAAVYIHCDISLCDETTHGCKPLCDGSGGFEESDMENGSGEGSGDEPDVDLGRRRRRRSNSNIKTLTSYPVFLHQPVKHV